MRVWNGGAGDWANAGCGREIARPTLEIPIFLYFLVSRALAIGTRNAKIFRILGPPGADENCNRG